MFFAHDVPRWQGLTKLRSYCSGGLVQEKKKEAQKCFHCRTVVGVFMVGCAVRAVILLFV